MSNQPQRAPDPDFLDGIDEQFQRLVKSHGNGKRSSRSARLAEDPIMGSIVDEMNGLSKSQKEQVLAYVQSLKKKAE